MEKKQKYKKVSRMATWLLPGMQIKRWFSLTIFGAFLISLGGAILLDLHPVEQSIQLIRSIAQLSPSSLTGSLVLLGGIIFSIWGLKKANSSLMGRNRPGRSISYIGNFI